MTSEYRAWSNMIDRCHRPKNKSYPDYGGRGIRVCDAWREDFVAFRTHIGPKPSPEHSIDRIDSSGHYEPGNVRWALRTQQNRNRRCVVKLTIGAETMCLSEWACRLGIKPGTLHARHQKGWPPERVLAEHVRQIETMALERAKDRGGLESDDARDLGREEAA